jgi:hypothetical protein
VDDLAGKFGGILKLSLRSNPEPVRKRKPDEPVKI